MVASLPLNCLHQPNKTSGHRLTHSFTVKYGVEVAISLFPEIVFSIYISVSERRSPTSGEEKSTTHRRVGRSKYPHLPFAKRPISRRTRPADRRDLPASPKI